MPFMLCMLDCRRFTDMVFSLGNPPYDRGNFFGSAKLDLSKPIATEQGQYLTQAQLQVYVTSQD